MSVVLRRMTSAGTSQTKCYAVVWIKYCREDPQEILCMLFIALSYPHCIPFRQPTDSRNSRRRDLQSSQQQPSAPREMESTNSSNSNDSKDEKVSRGRVIEITLPVVSASTTTHPSKPATVLYVVEVYLILICNRKGWQS